MKFLTLSICLLAGIALTSCKKNDAQKATTAQSTVTPTPSPIATPQREYPETPMTLNSGGTITIISEGTGDKPADGERVYFYYNLQSQDGEVLDRIAPPSKPMSFISGEGAVLPEWDEAMNYLRTGSIAEVRFSSDSTVSTLLGISHHAEELTMKFERVANPFRTKLNDTSEAQLTE